MLAPPACHRTRSTPNGSTGEAGIAVKTRVVVGSTVAVAAVLTAGWVIGSAGTTTTTAAPVTKLSDGTFTGAVEQTRYGPVQVQVTVAGGKITDVTALQLTNAEQRSIQISNAAAPILRSEVLKAQSASVATVSGATFTTEGYLTSLQSALDKAKA
jgi:uncharacterized protein with FMN-binding domain